MYEGVEACRRNEWRYLYRLNDDSVMYLNSLRGVGQGRLVS